MGRDSSQQTMLAKRRILVIDSHPLVRRGLTALIDDEPDLTVCAEAAMHRAGLEAISSSEPELVITDLLVEGNDPLDLVKDIRAMYKALPILVFTMHEASRFAQRAFQAGANGYVTKQEMGETLLLAIRQMLDGHATGGRDCAR